MRDDDMIGEGGASDDVAPGPGAATRRRFVRPAGVAVVLVYAWWAVALPPFSRSATVAVLIAGTTAVTLGALDRHRHRRRPSRGGTARPSGSQPTVIGWAMLALAATAWQLAAYVQQPRVDHPTVSSLVNALLDSQPTRAAAFVLWMAAAREISRR